MINYIINAILYLYFPFTLLVMIYYVIIYENKQLPYIKNIEMIVSELPVAQLSEDELFHEYEKGLNPRYSLLYIPLGIYKIYLLTWTKDKQFHFLKILSLKDIFDKKIKDKEKKLQSISDKSYEEYKQSNKIEKNQHIALLQDLIKQMQEREKTAQFKAMFYMTALAAILSVLIGNINKINEILNFDVLKQIVIGLILLYILNSLFLLLSFLSVSSYEHEKYSDFKKSQNKEKEYYSYWYKQYQRLKVYSDRDISYIKNIEKYLKITTFLTIILAILFLLKGVK